MFQNTVRSHNNPFCHKVQAVVDDNNAVLTESLVKKDPRQKAMWSPNRWNGRGAEVDNRTSNKQIAAEFTKEKTDACDIIHEAINSGIVVLSSIVGIEAMNCGVMMHCTQMKDVKNATKRLPEEDRVFAFHFLFRHVRDVIHKNTFHNTTFVKALEQCVLKFMNAETITNESDRRNGKRTMLEHLVAHMCNRKVQKLVKSMFGNDIDVSIESKLHEKPKLWRRNKGEFFVHKKTTNNNACKATETQKANG